MDNILCKYFSEKVYFGFFPVHYPVRDQRRRLGLLLTWIAMPSFFIVYNTFSHLTCAIYIGICSAIAILAIIYIALQMHFWC